MRDELVGPGTGVEPAGARHHVGGHSAEPVRLRAGLGPPVDRGPPTGEADWHEAQKKLRERLQARDDDVLDVIRKGEQLLFKEWADWVLVQFCYSWTYILGSADFSGPCANWNLV